MGSTYEKPTQMSELEENQRLEGQKQDKYMLPPPSIQQCTIGGVWAVRKEIESKSMQISFILLTILALWSYLAMLRAYPGSVLRITQDKPRGTIWDHLGLEFRSDACKEMALLHCTIFLIQLETNSMEQVCNL